MADQAGASRLLRLAHGGDLRDYLDRQHSNVAHALGVCAGDCPAPCAVMRQVPEADAGGLQARSRLALAYADTPFVRLRHSAPVGHGFGVPSPAEVTDAWQRSRERLGPAARHDDGFPLPGLPSLFSHLAGSPIEPDTLLADAVAMLVRTLSGAPAAATH
jgi:hypothetical protein